MVRVTKKAFRCLGIAESFRKNSKFSVLAGVVMRRDLIIDGVSVTLITVGGLDATEGVIRLYENLNRQDINLIMLSGVVIAWYNIVDLHRIYDELKIPLIALTYNPSPGIEHILARLPNAEERLRIYLKNGQREMILLKTGHKVYVRRLGVSLSETRAILNALTLTGRVPEPVRVAKLLARGVLRGLSGVFGDELGKNL